MSRCYLPEILLSLYIQLQYGLASILLKVSEPQTTILVDGDLTFLGLYSYLIKLSTCLSDIVLSKNLKFGFISFSIT